MDDFSAEARKISNVVGIWDRDFFEGELRKYSHENPEKRIQLVLQEYFEEKDELLTTWENDAQTIKEIFPDISLEEIMDHLEEVGYETNRIRIVVRKLLKKNSNRHLKRPSNVVEDGVVKRKKISTNADNCIANNEMAASSVVVNKDKCKAVNELAASEGTKSEVTSSFDSQATITYSFNESQDLEMAEVNVITSEDRNILLSVVETALKNQENKATVNLANGLGLGEVLISHSSTATASNHTSVIPSTPPDGEIVEDKNVLGVSEDISVTTSVELPGSSTSVTATATTLCINDPNADVTSTSNFSITTNKKPVLPSTSKDDEPSEEGAGNGGYHLYKHLMEMFTDVSRKDVKAICNLYNVKKHEQPSDKVFGCIVTDLLAITTSENSTSKNNLSAVERINFISNDIFVNDEVAEFRRPETQTSSSAPKPGPSTENSNLIAGTKNAATSTTRLVSNGTDTSAPNYVATVNRGPDLMEINNMLQEIFEDSSEDQSDEEVDVLDNIQTEETLEQKALIYPLMEMFPEASPQYIRRICQGKVNSPGVLDELITQILETEYPKRQKVASPEHGLDAEQQLEMLKQILPDADPNYLQKHCNRLIDKPDELKVFIAEAVEMRNYPKLKDYLRRQQISAQQKQYTSEFSIENFLEVIPDPIAYFEDPKRKQCRVDDFESHHYVICFLRNQFPKIHLRTIRDIFRQRDLNFIQSFKALAKFNPKHQMKSKRGETRMPEVIQNIPLLQEIAYMQHRTEIKKYLEMLKQTEVQEREEAKAAGLLQTCSCCYDDEVMPKDIYTCENGCIFCKECVRQGAEVAFGDGNLNFACLNNCSSHFSLQVLQAVLNPKMFSKVAQKKQLEEVKAAGIEDLEMCPFCDFATIPARDDKLFRCLNPECMKESCRLCKEPSHVPLRCEEVEKEDDVKIRTYIENKMTEALLRTCYKCNKKFIKAEGCNKMTCSCGALMCYVCGKPVKDYKHFNGPGGDQFQLCPLYSDTNQLHEEAVLKGAEAAKREVGVDSDPSKLKIDPTAGLQQHYNEMAKKNPAPPGVQYIDPVMAAINNNILAIHQQLVGDRIEVPDELNENLPRHRHNLVLHNHRRHHNFHHHHHQP